MIVDPFAVLGITPTLEGARVKRAYFARLAQHPPHADPEGFRRLRGAYEALQQSGGLVAAFFAAPVTAGAAAERYRDLDEALAAIQARRRAATAARAAGQRFVDAMSRLTWEEALAVVRAAPHG